MDGFVDETWIEVSSGKGGDGAVSFRREKYAPKGGPDGGDGGKGGDVVFVVRDNLKTLSSLKMKNFLRAENGKPGLSKRRHGRDGADVEIVVPAGTIIREIETKKVLMDLTQPDECWVFLKGGKGGRGNWHFSTPTRQAPRYAERGESGKTIRLLLELSIIADIGLIGYPNAGKSTLLSVLTNAHPEIGNYSFTTKVPNLGVIKYNYRDLIIADIPGIIEGASRGAGLGLKFLKHIGRTKGLLFLIDLSSSDFTQTFEKLLNELKAFDLTLLNKPRVLVGSKMDLENTEEKLLQLKLSFPKEDVIGVSAITHRGIEVLKNKILELAIQ